MALCEHDVIHCLHVGQRMQELAEKEYKFNPDVCNQLFVVGLLHMVGNEIEESDNSSTKGGWLLRQMGFSYWKEIAYQDSADWSYTSIVKDLLLRAKKEVDAEEENASE